MFHLTELITWQTAATTVAVYWTTLVIYRLFFHPLAKFPGPKLAAATLWYEGYHDVVRNGQYTWKIAELHKKYGESMFLHLNNATQFLHIF